MVAAGLPETLNLLSHVTTKRQTAMVHVDNTVILCLQDTDIFILIAYNTHHFCVDIFFSRF
jgi:hypothetical protein